MKKLISFEGFVDLENLDSGKIELGYNQNGLLGLFIFIDKVPRGYTNLRYNELPEFIKEGYYDAKIDRVTADSIIIEFEELDHSGEGRGPLVAPRWEIPRWEIISDRFRDFTLIQIGEVIWDNVSKDNGTYSRDMAKELEEVFGCIKNEHEFELVQKAIMAFTGKGMDDILGEVWQRKEAGEV